MSIIIRDARPADVEQLQDVFYRTWLATYPNAAAGVTEADVEARFNDRHDPARIKKRQADIAALSPEARYLVAADGDRIVALCRAEHEGDHGRINAIYVLPDYQRRGIGNMLWRALQDFFDPMQEVYVSVAVYNAPAIHFYESLGFRDTGKRFTEERLRMQSGAVIEQMDMRLDRAFMRAS